MRLTVWSIFLLAFSTTLLRAVRMSSVDVPWSFYSIKERTLLTILSSFESTAFLDSNFTVSISSKHCSFFIRTCFRNFYKVWSLSVYLFWILVYSSFPEVSITRFYDCASSSSFSTVVISAYSLLFWLSNILICFYLSFRSVSLCSSMLSNYSSLLSKSFSFCTVLAISDLTCSVKLLFSFSKFSSFLLVYCTVNSLSVSLS